MTESHRQKPINSRLISINTIDPEPTLSVAVLKAPDRSDTVIALGVSYGIKIGAKAFSRGRYLAFQMAEVAISLHLYQPP
jgi:hypothetical protein